MLKCYVKVDGMWVRVYELHGWYDLLCWTCTVGILATIGICLLWQVCR